ncbi:PrsW family intramembrane metalloprotease [candidate division KSB1 bacterium]|nr:PrsW family intramembrane metalloprotease [candidate division KSB1 bacterium]RQV99740.1 MAG: PrsW family intramembrane metalloprotease [candidate division KSB1 bacterium]
MSILKIVFSLFPVLIFLIALVSLDSYKLVRLTAVLKTICLGGVVALVAYFLNTWLSPLFADSLSIFIRYISPVIEETLKAIYIVYLIRTNKVGFLVDAAICGFAIGAGFAMVENIYYLQSLQQSNMLVWLIRGCGTAVMHGGTTAICAILNKSMSERQRNKFLAIVPGLLAAILIHSIFNHFFIPPIFTTIAQLATLPLFLIVIFSYSEKVLRNWLELGMDNDVQLLDSILTGTISETRAGMYLLSLKKKFPGEVVADMLCFLRIHLELAIRAKGMLLLRNAGFRATMELDIREKLIELKFLEKSIGTTGKLALSPIVHSSTRDLWQLYVVQQ